ncbi:MAG: cell division protein FtsQ/DivIB [Gammaproteobacteria bacterium]|nr:cell division protein FtsQ/DivIB [Gammaproteobacteria bacterium]
MSRTEAAPRQFGIYFVLLVLLAFALAARLVYATLSSPDRFPIHTVKIEATYEHVTRELLEGILSSHLKESFFSISTQQLEAELLSLDWSATVRVTRKWPDILEVVLVEKKPVAVWNNAFVASDGTLFEQGKVSEGAFSGPYLYGPPTQQQEVLQTYEKLSKLLAMYGLSAVSLRLSDNQAWELVLTNGLKVRLGKRDLVQRLRRFCRAYPAVFGDKPELLSCVDLRYARGMAVQWKQQTRKSGR